MKMITVSPNLLSFTRLLRRLQTERCVHVIMEVITRNGPSANPCELVGDRGRIEVLGERRPRPRRRCYPPTSLRGRNRFRWLMPAYVEDPCVTSQTGAAHEARTPTGQACQTPRRSRPRSGTDRPMLWVQAQTLAVGSGPGGRRRGRPPRPRCHVRCIAGPGVRWWPRCPAVRKR